MGGRRVNWDELRASYVEGDVPDPGQNPFRRVYPTLEEVSVLHGVEFARVRQRSAQEGWVAQRERFQAEVEEARRRHLRDQKVEQTTRIDDRGLSNAEAGLGLVSMRLTFLLNAQTRLAHAERGTGIDARELSTLGLAAKRFLDLKAQIMGQPSTADEGRTLDEIERAARLDDERVAEDLVRFIQQREAEDDEADAPV